MTKWQFQQICERNDLARERSSDTLGGRWLTPLLILEAEQDRNDLILFCIDLAKKNKELKTDDPTYLGCRPTPGNTEKNMDTGEVTDKPDYIHIDEFEDLKNVNA